jgi:hypothetical protein
MLELDDREATRRLFYLLDRLLRAMTKRGVWANNRIMQKDVGEAIGLLHGHDVPGRSVLAPLLSKLIRELGSPRPNLHNYVTTLEDILTKMQDEYGPDGDRWHG